MVIELTEEQAKAIVFILKHNWIPPDYQNVIYALVTMLENRLYGT